jgi:hypothetical protein
MASSIDIRPILVDHRVDNEASRVDGFVCAADPRALVVDHHHVRYLKEPKVHPIGIDPEAVGLDWIRSCVS